MNIWSKVPTDSNENATQLTYSNDPKHLDRYIWANSDDLDQTVQIRLLLLLAMRSGTTVLAVRSMSFGFITLWQNHLQILGLCLLLCLLSCLLLQFLGVRIPPAPHPTPIFMVLFTSEPPRDKTNKVTVRPAKTQISLGIRPD